MDAATGFRCQFRQSSRAGRAKTVVRV
jgi:hypothetical protein